MGKFTIILLCAACLAAGTASTAADAAGRKHRIAARCQRVHLHRCVCPAWYERTFWGAYRLYSPCSNRVNTHAF